MWWIVLLKQIVSRKRMELLSDLSLIPTFFFSGSHWSPIWPVKMQFFFTWPGIFYMFFLNIHNTNKMLISERYFESCRRGQMVGTTKNIAQPRKNDPKETTSITQISGFHRLQFLRSKDSTRSTGPLCVSHWHSRWWSGSLLTSQVERKRPIMGHSKGWL